MNYEEVIENRNTKLLQEAVLPIGTMYKQLVDKKYQNVVRIRQEIVNDIVVNGDLGYEYNVQCSLNSRHLLHYQTIIDDNRQIKGLLVEQGSYVSVDELLKTNPAIVASPDFIGDMVNSVVEVATYLHHENIYHLCFAPSTVLCRKGSDSILLLNHGSFFTNKLEAVYGEYRDFMAPELFNGGKPDERADVYSIGKFIESLFVTRTMPINYKKVIEKATRENPDERYQNVDGLASDLKKKTVLIKALMIAAAVFVVLAIGTFVWLDTSNDDQQMEYIKPAPKETDEDYLDKGFNAETEMGVISNDDSLNQMTPQQKKEEQMYQQKAEQIFRKQFSQKANDVLSKIYNNKNMNQTEKKFMSSSQQTMNELMKIQDDLGSKAGISGSKSQIIATQIIDQLSKQRMDALKKQGGY